MENSNFIKEQKAGFKLPSDYFETFQDKITEQIATENISSTSSPKVISLWKNKTLIAITSAAAVILITITLFLNITQSKNNTNELVEIDYLFEESPIETTENESLLYYYLLDESDNSIDNYVISTIVPEELLEN